MADRDQVQRQVSIAAPPEDVWSALTDGDQLAVWFGGRVELEPRFGGVVRITDEDRRLLRGTVEAVEPARRLAFRVWDPEHNGSRVEFELEPAPDGTLLTVTETRLSPSPRPAGASTSPLRQARMLARV